MNLAIVIGIAIDTIPSWRTSRAQPLQEYIDRLNAVGGVTTSVNTMCYISCYIRYVYLLNIIR